MTRYSVEDMHDALQDIIKENQALRAALIDIGYWDLRVLIDSHTQPGYEGPMNYARKALKWRD